MGGPMDATRLIAAALSAAALVGCTETAIEDDVVVVGSDPSLDCTALGACDGRPAGQHTPPPAPPQPWAPPTLSAWPGNDATATADPGGTFGGNMSDLF